MMFTPGDGESYRAFMARSTGAHADPGVVARLYSEHGDRAKPVWARWNPVFDAYFWDALALRWRRPIEHG